MRKLAYFAAVALLCTGIAVAQDQSQQNPSSSPSTQQPSSNPSGNAADQNQANPSPDQNQANPSGQEGQAGQAGQTGAASGEAAQKGKKLPQTASPLPFLSLLGMGMMGAGSLRRYFKK